MCFINIRKLYLYLCQICFFVWRNLIDRHFCFRSPNLLVITAPFCRHFCVTDCVAGCLRYRRLCRWSIADCFPDQWQCRRTVADYFPDQRRCRRTVAVISRNSRRRIRACVGFRTPIVRNLQCGQFRRKLLVVFLFFWSLRNFFRGKFVFW